MKTLTVAILSFLSLTRARKVEAVSYTVGLGSQQDVCLKEMEEARTIAGLNNFKQLENPFPETSDDVWQVLCSYVASPPGHYEEPDVDQSSINEPPGVYAYAKLTSSNPDCGAIVQEWKDARVNFSEPPPRKSAGDAIYAKTDNVSMVALYNPGPDASAACSVFSCKKNGGSDAVYSLLCRTTPDAFAGDKEPFTQEQWNKILASAGTSSARAFVSSLLAFAVTAMAGAGLVL